MKYIGILLGGVFVIVSYVAPFILLFELNITGGSFLFFFTTIGIGTATLFSAFGVFLLTVLLYEKARGIERTVLIPSSMAGWRYIPSREQKEKVKTKEIIEALGVSLIAPMLYILPILDLTTTHDISPPISPPDAHFIIEIAVMLFALVAVFIFFILTIVGFLTFIVALYLLARLYYR